MNINWMSSSISRLCRCALVFLPLVAVSMPASAVILEKRIAVGADDAEERVNGSVPLTSSDIEMAFDAGGDQTVGLRFIDLDIPDGAIIENAYIQFQVDEVNIGPTSLTIQGEYAGSAAAFENSFGNISLRTRTAAAAFWSPVPWEVRGAQTEDQRTSDISAVVQEVISHPNWVAGNALAIIVTGTGERTAESYDGDAAAAAMLHIEYSEGTPINRAPEVEAGGDLTIELPETSVDISAATVSDDSRPYGWQAAVWDVQSSPAGESVSFSPGVYAINPTAIFSGVGTYVLRLRAWDGELIGSDTVTVNVLPEGAAVNTVEQRVSASSDDAEENGLGSVGLTSSDIEMVFDAGSNQTVGLRFTNLDIPNGAVIQRAYIQFDVDEDGAAATSLNIQAEYSESAATFESEQNNISSRTRTSTSVPWAPAAWSNAIQQGPDQQTPDISLVIQEAVAHPGWVEGNALAIIITGNGERTAESFDGEAAAAPMLHVEYSGGTPDTSFKGWGELGLKLDGVDAAIDSYNNRILMSLADGYETPQTLTAVVEYDPAGNVGLGFDSGAVATPGAAIDLGNIRYGSSIPVDLYEDGVLTETYTMVFTNLTVIELAAELIVDEPKSPGTFKLTSALFGQYTGTMNMGIEYRGATSQRYPKKSFSIEIVEDDDPEDERKLALLDLRKDGDWLLDATYRDTAFVRNIVSMDIFNDMRPFAYIDAAGTPQGQAAIRGHQVEVILNGRYHGAFILEEKVDRKLLDMEKVDVPEDADGNELWDQVDFTNPDNGTVLYKADTNDADLYFPGDIQDDFEQKYPKDDDILHYGPLFELITFLNDSTDQEFIEQQGDIIDIDSAVDFWIMTNLTLNRDSLKKNYYLARNMTEKWFFVPWDNDATFGMYWDGSPYTSVSWWDPQKNNLIRRLAENPETGFNTLVKQRWTELRGTIFTVEALTARFAQYRADSVPIAGVSENARERNFTRWPESGGEGIDNPELGTVAYIEEWIGRRIEFLDERIMEQEE